MTAPKESGGPQVTPSETVIHASAVAMQGKALLILGKSGSGKSALALELIGLGASLVSDDRTILDMKDDRLHAGAPPSIRGLIEARHVGLLRLPCTGPTPVGLAIDLDIMESDRLPPPRSRVLLGQPVPLLHRPPGTVPAYALLQCLLHNRETP